MMNSREAPVKVPHVDLLMRLVRYRVHYAAALWDDRKDPRTEMLDLRASPQPFVHHECYLAATHNHIVALPDLLGVRPIASRKTLRHQ